MISVRRKIRFVSELTQRVQELQASIPADPAHSLTPKARACLDDWRSRTAPADQYAALISDGSPFPAMPGGGVEIKDGDNPEALLTKMQDAYRTEIETGAKLMEMRRVFEKLQGAVK